MSQNIQIGTKFRGIYMSMPFTGTVTSIEPDCSGYRDMDRVIRVYIKVDQEMWWPEHTYWDDETQSNITIPSWRRCEIGECIIMTCQREAHGKLSRTDSKFDECFIVKPS
jgi:hypothetical protein